MSLRFFLLEDHFECIQANIIRCEECNESFYFDFLRHPRYFVTHFKTCHLKNLLYRLNGYTQQENKKIRFGPRRKRDTNTWFSQLKSTEKRMISIQDNRWSEITEKTCWSCRLCNDGKGELTRVFDTDEVGRSLAFLHLQQSHESIVRSLENATPHAIGSHPSPTLPISMGRTVQQRFAEAQRSRERRLKATSEQRRIEAERSKRRRENLTPIQRQADYDRRKRRKKPMEETERSRQRRANATAEMKEKEVLRSRERRRMATDEQRQREALRSRRRRQNATETQKLKERERNRLRYELKKQQKQQLQHAMTKDPQQGEEEDHIGAEDVYIHYHAQQPQGQQQQTYTPLDMCLSPAI